MLFSKNRLILSGVVSAIVVLAAVPSIYFYRQYKSVQRKLANPTEYAQEETRLIQEKVGKLIELPTDEVPTIATVTDAAKLSEQPFFVKAQNGDRVLIFTNAKKAILYRPSSNKIIEVAPVNIGQNAPSGTPAPTPPPTGGPTPTPGKTSPTPTLKP